MGRIPVIVKETVLAKAMSILFNDNENEAIKNELKLLADKAYAHISKQRNYFKIMNLITETKFLENSDSLTYRRVLRPGDRWAKTEDLKLSESKQMPRFRDSSLVEFQELPVELAEQIEACFDKESDLRSSRRKTKDKIESILSLNTLKSLQTKHPALYALVEDIEEITEVPGSVIEDLAGYKVK